MIRDNEMTPSEFVYRQIFDKAIQLGVSEESANTQASIGVNQYKTNQFDTVVELIEDRVKAAFK